MVEPGTAIIYVFPSLMPFPLTALALVSAFSGWRFCLGREELARPGVHWSGPLFCRFIPSSVWSPTPLPGHSYIPLSCQNHRWQKKLDYFFLTLFIPFPPEVQTEKAGSPDRRELLNFPPCLRSFFPPNVRYLVGLRGRRGNGSPASTPPTGTAEETSPDQPCSLYHSVQHPQEAHHRQLLACVILCGAINYSAIHKGFLNSPILFLDAWSLTDGSVQNGISCIHTGVLHAYKPVVLGVERESEEEERRPVTSWSSA